MNNVLNFVRLKVRARKGMLLSRLQDKVEDWFKCLWYGGRPQRQRYFPIGGEMLYSTKVEEVYLREVMNMSLIGAALEGGNAEGCVRVEMATNFGKPLRGDGHFYYWHPDSFKKTYVPV